LFSRVSLALAWAALAGAVEVVSPQRERFDDAPTFAGGKDVFGRPPSCQACHMLLANFEGALLPKLRTTIAADRKRREGRGSSARRQDFGVIEGVVEEVVSGGCMFAATYHKPRVRRACEELLEEHEEGLVQAYYRWAKAVAAEETVEGEERVTRRWAWNYEVCYRATEGACPEELALRDLNDFEDDGSGEMERTYRSEPAFTGAARWDGPSGGLLKTTAAKFHDDCVADESKDCLAYAALPTRAPEFHAALMPALRSLADLVRTNRTFAKAFTVCIVDAEHNDVPPPYGEGITGAQLVLFPAQQKRTPRFLTEDADGELALFDLLSFIARAGGGEVAVAAAARLLVGPDALDEHSLYKRPVRREDL